MKKKHQSILSKIIDGEDSEDSDEVNERIEQVVGDMTVIDE